LNRLSKDFLERRRPPQTAFPRQNRAGPIQGTRLPPWVIDEKASIRLRMKDARGGQESIRQVLMRSVGCSPPWGAVLLAAAP